MHGTLIEQGKIRCLCPTTRTKIESYWPAICVAQATPVASQSGCQRFDIKCIDNDGI